MIFFFFHSRTNFSDFFPSTGILVGTWLSFFHSKGESTPKTQGEVSDTPTHRNTEGTWDRGVAWWGFFRVRWIFREVGKVGVDLQEVWRFLGFSWCCDLRVGLRAGSVCDSVFVRMFVVVECFLFPLVFGTEFESETSVPVRDPFLQGGLVHLRITEMFVVADYAKGSNFRIFFIQLK